MVMPGCFQSPKARFLRATAELLTFRWGWKNEVTSENIFV